MARIRVVDFTFDDEGRRIPAAPCWNCHSEVWWKMKWGDYLCLVCHPDPVVLREEWENEQKAKLSAVQQEAQSLDA